MWYHEYLQLAEAKAIKAEEPALPLSALIDMERLNSKIRSSSTVQFHRQTRGPSGRWAMDEEIARDGVLKNAKAELVTLAARYRVSVPGMKEATAELINTAGKASSALMRFCVADEASLSHRGSTTPTTRVQIRFLPLAYHNV